MAFFYFITFVLVLNTSNGRSYPVNDRTLSSKYPNDLFPNDDLFQIRKFDQNPVEDGIENVVSVEEPEMMDLAATHIFHPLFRVRKPRNGTSDRIDQANNIFLISK